MTVDERKFICAARKRDARLAAGDGTADVGPAGWLCVWQDAETLIRVNLWPAVYAVAWEMVLSPRALTYIEIAGIAEAGMRLVRAEA